MDKNEFNRLFHAAFQTKPEETISLEKFQYTVFNSLQKQVNVRLSNLKSEHESKT